MREKLIGAPPKDECLVTGYSGGGAIATHLAAELAANFSTHLITFGQPRVEDVDTEKLARLKTHIRVVNPLDPVTYLPSGVPHHGEQKKVFWWGNPHSMNRYAISG